MLRIGDKAEQGAAQHVQAQPGLHACSWLGSTTCCIPAGSVALARRLKQVAGRTSCTKLALDQQHARRKGAACVMLCRCMQCCRGPANATTMVHQQATRFIVEHAAVLLVDVVSAEETCVVCL